MARTTPAPPRPELALVGGCACEGARCSMSGPCLDAALSDERFAVWAPRRRTRLRLAS